MVTHCSQRLSDACSCLLFDRGLFAKYVPLLLYPSSSVRHSAVAFVNASFRALGFPDGVVFLLPIVRPFLRFEPSTHHLTVCVVCLSTCRRMMNPSYCFFLRWSLVLPDQTPDGLRQCLILPWTRSRLHQELKKLSEKSRDTQLGTQWTAIDEEPSSANSEISELALSKQEHQLNSHPALSTQSKGGGDKVSAMQLSTILVAIYSETTLLTISC